MRTLRLSFVALAVCALSFGVFAQENKEKAAKAQSLVEKGIAFYKANGKEKSWEAFNDKAGKFFDGEFYLFVFDYTGMCYAHGANPKFPGKNQIDLMDATGKPIIKSFIDVSKTKGSGWVDYKWSNPETKKVQPKETWIKKLSDDSFIGCGYYQ